MIVRDWQIFGISEGGGKGHLSCVVMTFSGKRRIGLQLFEAFGHHVGFGEMFQSGSVGDKDVAPLFSQ